MGKKGVSFLERNLEEDAGLLKTALSKGFSAAPVVIPLMGDDLLWDKAWSGFNPDRIDALA